MRTGPVGDRFRLDPFGLPSPTPREDQDCCRDDTVAVRRRTQLPQEGDVRLAHFDDGFSIDQDLLPNYEAPSLPIEHDSSEYVHNATLRMSAEGA
jgi:hypothetical protein